MPRYGAVDVDACEPCPSGYKCDELETIIPEVCDVGYYCAEGSGDAANSPPVQCVAGEYCP